MASKKTAPTPDLFDLAKAQTTPKPKKEKVEAPKTLMGNALQMVAACAALEANIKDVKDTYMATLKDEALEIFVDRGLEAGARPENFKAENGLAEAGVELKIRPNTSLLTEPEVKALKASGVKVEAQKVKDEAFEFNMELLKDPALRAKLSKALGSVDFGGVQPIIHRPAEFKLIATEDMIETVLKAPKVKTAKVKKDAGNLLRTITVVTVKPKWNGTKAQAYTVLASDLMAAQTQK